MAQLPVVLSGIVVIGGYTLVLVFLCILLMIWSSPGLRILSLLGLGYLGLDILVQWGLGERGTLLLASGLILLLLGVLRRERSKEENLPAGVWHDDGVAFSDRQLTVLLAPWSTLKRLLGILAAAPPSQRKAERLNPGWGVALVGKQRAALWHWLRNAD